MGRFEISRLLISVFALFLVCGCSYPISGTVRQQAAKDLTFSMVLANPAKYDGAVVIWGGIIIETINHKEGTEVVVLETPLDYDGEPEDSEYSRGRFIARTSGYLDPEMYKRGRKVTVAGEVVSPEKRKIGEMTYTYPVVSIKEIHLWEVQKVYYPPYYYGYGWYGPYYGYGPYWGPPFGPWPYGWY